MTASQRADARRNYERILAVATAEVAEHGADASLEKIARVAGVGSATVRRHFPSRYALLEAVSRVRVDVLCAYAGRLGDAPDPREALLAWLREVLDYCIAARGLAVALSYSPPGGGYVQDNSCSAPLEAASAPILARAQSAGLAKPAQTAADLITLVVGIALATEGHPDRSARAHRLLRVVADGL